MAKVHGDVFGADENVFGDVFGEDEGGGGSGDAVMVLIDIPAAELEIIDLVCVKLSCVG
jgi:hypothetical protein